MRKYNLFKVLGFEISLDISWFFILALIVWTLGAGYFPSIYPSLSPATHWIMGGVAAILLFISVLVHELSHSVVARSRGLQISGIRLFIFGGVSEMTEEPESAGDEFKIAVVGPLTSLVLAIIFFALSFLPIRGWSLPTFAILRYLALLNFALAIFNLIPGFPLDGGRVLRAILWGRSHNLQKATNTATTVGKGFAFILIAFGAITALSGSLIGGIWYIFIGMFLNMAAESGKQQTIMRQALIGVKVRDLMSQDVVHVDPGLSCHELVDDYILKYRFDMFPVMRNDGVLVGLVSLDDVKKLPRDEWATSPVQQVMEPVREELILHPDEEAVDCLSRMVTSHEQGRMPVVDDKNDLVGVVTRRDIMNLLRIKTDLGA